MNIQKEHAQPTPTSLTIRTLLRPTLASMPTQLLKQPMGTRTKFKNLEGAPFTMLKSPQPMQSPELFPINSRFEFML